MIVFDDFEHVLSKASTRTLLRQGCRKHLSNAHLPGWVLHTVLAVKLSSLLRVEKILFNVIFFDAVFFLDVVSFLEVPNFRRCTVLTIMEVIEIQHLPTKANHLDTFSARKEEDQSQEQRDGMKHATSALQEQDRRYLQGWHLQAVNLA